MRQLAFQTRLSRFYLIYKLYTSSVEKLRVEFVPFSITQASIEILRYLYSYEIFQHD